MIFLLSLNMSKTFDNVSHTRLLHNMWKRRMFILLLNWIKNFLKERRTILTIDEYTLLERRAKIYISQNFSLSFILSFFYNVDLLKNCDDIKIHTSIIDFVNDVNILTYNDSTKRNCEKLKKNIANARNDAKRIIRASTSTNANSYILAKHHANTICSKESSWSSVKSTRKRILECSMYNWISNFVDNFMWDNYKLSWLFEQRSFKRWRDSREKSWWKRDEKYIQRSSNRC